MWKNMVTKAFYLGAFGCNSRLLKMTIIMKGADMDIIAKSWYFGVMGGHHGSSWNSVVSFCCATWASA